MRILPEIFMGNFIRMLTRLSFVIYFVYLSVGSFAQSPVNIPLQIYLSGETVHIKEFVVSGDLTKLRTFCEDLNIDYREIGNDQLVVLTGKSGLRKLIQKDVITHIDFSFGNTGHLLSDSMLVNNRIVAVHDSSKWPEGNYTGKGVLIGFIDTGIDFTHPDFKDSTSKSRVVAIWDQAADTTNQNRIPQPYNYGLYWTKNDIDNNLCSHDDDILSHGTNVAGIASGNGLAIGAFKGVSPNSHIMMVASDFGHPNWLNTVADGVEMIFRKADSMQVPCVVNISAGTYLGSHDGEDPAAIRIKNLIEAKSGRVVVCAAGNLGTLPFHLGYNITSDTNFTWFKYNPNISGIYFELWSDTSDFKQAKYSVGADRVVPSYKFVGGTNFRDISSNLNTIITDSIYTGSHRIALVQTYAERIGSRYQLQVFIPSPDSSQYNFRLQLTGNGKFDLWSHQALGWSSMIHENLPLTTVFPEIQYYRTPDTLKTVVGSFASLPEVLTVGNYVNRDRYIDVNNILQLDTALVGEDVTPGMIATNSCTGPNRKDLRKPDISASGDFTLTANRLASIPLHIANNQSNRIAKGGMHKRNGGTSMASPVVAGVVALMLERCPNSSNQEIRDAILGTAYSDSFAINLPNQKWGYGKVDGLAVINGSFIKAPLSPSNDIDLCDGDSVNLTAGVGYNDVRWSTGDSTLSLIGKNTGTYSFSALDSMGCRQYSDTVSLRVKSNPAKPLVYESLDSLITDHIGPVFQWFLDSVEIPNENNRFLIPKLNGNYMVQVTDTGGCSSFSSEVEVLTSILTKSDRKDYQVFPNPSNGIINLKWNQNSEPESIRLFDMLGRRIEFDQMENSKNGVTLSINDSSRGINYIHLVSNGDVRVIKILIQ